ncbi:MAG: prolipoprotein diacylglyceryl transferase [Bacteroidetes bacterium HGW-Bacteroidetes-17]|nr:MAG: prolipoprotein diacylglyceryl transferase [Bacteroidetes bacterium HGW-Bacteroidetes-17]
MNFIQKLKKRWGIRSGLQVIIILIVFSCTGFSVLYVEELILKLINLNHSNNWWVAILIFILITLPLYNALLLIYGFIFGQFKFFWNFEKRFFGRMISLFGKKS